MPTLTDVVQQTLEQFVDGIVAAFPRLLSGVIFLLLAAALIHVVLWGVRGILRRAAKGQELYVQFGTTVVAVFLWFGAILTFLTVVGLTEIAAALGTASGFLALGVSYALSGMIADAVAGIYLLRDPDFNPGDRISVGDTEGTVKEIELRKTRFHVKGDTVVRANAEVEKKWTKREEVEDVGTE
ncbi:mechanosensitive ion channel domain-containing protein [Halospeciosus flavus]|uniref:Mechanosensitive ion channel domain-containing protein n=1 Tax=Halospeciosus flavus TaxID=3032283 RepID=A0ABD5Z8U4_9EURY|nr:mechanosensitive ion channel domain-containing protein [Halospeciosus flavus]